MQILRQSDATHTNEFNLKLRRILPRGDIGAPMGAAWGSLKSGNTTPDDHHDEHEILFILVGRGELTVDEEMSPVEAGDIIYLPPFCHHQLHNPSGGQELQLLTMWWGGAAAATGTSPEGGAR